MGGTQIDMTKGRVDRPSLVPIDGISLQRTRGHCATVACLIHLYYQTVFTVVQGRIVRAGYEWQRQPGFGYPVLSDAITTKEGILAVNPEREL